VYVLADIHSNMPK